jgi:flagellar motor switch protein FliN/FliY
MDNMDAETFKLNEMEIDVIGEVMNISMGAAATALSTILDKKVNITTPRIETLKIEEFEISYLEPVVGVLIKYVEGIDGTNILLMKEEDFKKILGHLLSTDPEDMTEFDEISVSAICEIMNQMMGSAASALASFLGHVVNISPPEILDMEQKNGVKERFSLSGDSLVSIKFNIQIEGLFESEFISAMEPELARKIVSMSIGANEVEEEPVQVPVQTTPPVQAESMAVQANDFSQEGERYQAEVDARSIDHVSKEQVSAKDYQYKTLGADRHGEQKYADNNLELIMSVPIQITVELGKTSKKIKDIADLTVGNIVELDRQAGDQVDVVANGRLIAKGDVVVVDDNYSVRITEIIKIKEIPTN